jgi:hypothetical protein
MKVQTQVKAGLLPRIIYNRCETFTTHKEAKP